jgi:hypothetical protein
MAAQLNKHFLNYHGMFCGPAAAKICTDSFTGRVLFLPSQNTTSDILEPLIPMVYESKELRKKDLKKGMTVRNYYKMVFSTFTGVSTFLRLTDISEPIIKTLDEGGIDPKKHPDIAAVLNDAQIMKYLQQKGKGLNDFTAIRKFDYYFSLVCLRVTMIHLIESSPKKTSDEGDLHLIEIYNLDRSSLKTRAISLFAAVGAASAYFYL